MSVPKSDPASTSLPIGLEATEVSSAKTIWRLELFPDRLALSSNENPDPLVFPRVEFGQKLQYAEGLGFLVVKYPREFQLKLKPRDVGVFWNWWSPPTRENLAVTLRKRHGFSLILAIIFLLGFLDTTGQTMLELIFWGLLTFLLLLTWAISRFRPHPIAFVLDAGWFLLLAIGLMVRIATGGSWAWAILIVFNFWIAALDWKSYRRFSALR